MRPVLRPSDLLTLSFLVLFSGLAVFSARMNPSWAGLLAAYTVLAVVIVAVAMYRTESELGKEGFLPFYYRHGDHGFSLFLIVWGLSSPAFIQQNSTLASSPSIIRSSAFTQRCGWNG